MNERHEGSVIAIHGALVSVQVGDTTMVVAARRKLQWEKGQPEAARLVVGDQVYLEINGNDGVIVGVKQRRSSMIRRAAHGRRPQILAANVDQALIVFAAGTPKPKQGLIDRFLVATYLAGIEGIITINKRDQGLKGIERWLKIYEELGYRVLRVSARTGWGLGQIRRLLEDRTTLFCGPSGVGKSSLLNAVYPGFRLKVGSISEATGKGKQTTTMGELMPLPFGGFVVDTPGLKEFGLWNVTAKEIEAAFPEIASLAIGCHFPNCSHLHEPDCRVRDAMRAEEIDNARYRTYKSLIEERKDD